MIKYLVALYIHPEMGEESSRCLFEDFDIIDANSAEEAKKMYDIKHNCSYYYGFTIGEIVGDKIGVKPGVFYSLFILDEGLYMKLHEWVNIKAEMDAMNYNVHPKRYIIQHKRFIVGMKYYLDDNNFRCMRCDLIDAEDENIAIKRYFPGKDNNIKVIGELVDCRLLVMSLNNLEFILGKKVILVDGTSLL